MFASIFKRCCNCTLIIAGGWGCGGLDVTIPPENFKNMCNFMCFAVYLDQVLSYNSPDIPFLYI